MGAHRHHRRPSASSASSASSPASASAPWSRPSARWSPSSPRAGKRNLLQRDRLQRRPGRRRARALRRDRAASTRSAGAACSGSARCRSSCCSRWRWRSSPSRRVAGLAWSRRGGRSARHGADRTSRLPSAADLAGERPDREGRVRGAGHPRYALADPAARPDELRRPAAHLRPQHLAAADHGERGLRQEGLAGLPAGAQRRRDRRRRWSRRRLADRAGAAAGGRLDVRPRRRGPGAAHPGPAVAGAARRWSRWPASAPSAPRC